MLTAPLLYITLVHDTGSRGRVQSQRQPQASLKLASSYMSMNVGQGKGIRGCMSVISLCVALQMVQDSQPDGSHSAGTGPTLSYAHMLSYASPYHMPTHLYAPAYHMPTVRKSDNAHQQIGLIFGCKSYISLAQIFDRHVWALRHPC